MANHVLILGHGSSVLCIDVNDGTEHVFRVAKPFADGVSNVTGHSKMLMFAFAEQNNASRVFVLSYPDFKKVACIMPPAQASTESGDTKPPVRRICSIAFSESEHLIVLTGYPHYELEVWNWRTQKMMGSHETGLITDLQFIKYIDK